jgi:putative membrane protein
MRRFPRSLALAALLALPGALSAQADLDDLEMAHVAVTASEIDIAYAHLALALSENPAVRRFAETMIRDHTAVNEQVAALAARLGVEARDNALSHQLLSDARGVKDEMSRLRGGALDRFYAENELAYHRTVNGVVADAFIPNVENAKVKEAFETALALFRGHERHADMLVEEIGDGRGSRKR